MPNEDEIERALSLDDLEALVEQGKFEITWPENLAIPSYIKDIISKATAISPDERYKKIDEMIDELLIFLDSTLFDFTHKATFIETKDKTKEIENQELKEIIERIIRRDESERNLPPEIKKGATEKFNKLLEDKIQDVINGFKKNFQSIIINAIRRAQDYENNYVGIEHIFLALPPEGIFVKVLRKTGKNFLEIKEKLKSYTRHNKVLAVERLFSPRLEKILNELKEKYPDGIGEKEFIISALKESSLISLLLQEEGINIEKFIEEVRNYEI